MAESSTVFNLPIVGTIDFDDCADEAVSETMIKLTFEATHKISKITSQIDIRIYKKNDLNYLLKYDVDVSGSIFRDGNFEVIEAYKPLAELIKRFYKPYYEGLIMIDDKIPPVIIADNRSARQILNTFYKSNVDPFQHMGAQGYVLPENYNKKLQPEDICFLYYMSVWMKVLHINPYKSVNDYNEGQLEKISYLTLYTSNSEPSNLPTTEFSSGTLYFQCLFSLYSLCKSNATRAQLREWCKKRMAALCAGIGLPITTYNIPDMESSANLLATYSSKHAEVRSFVWDVIQGKLFTEKAKLADKTVITQVKTLVAYAEMTAYSLITKYIASGHYTLIIKVVGEETIKFMKEKEGVVKYLELKGLKKDDLPYYKLINPRDSKFKIKDYPNLMVAAVAYEKFANTGSKHTIGNYKYHSKGAVITEAQITSYLISGKLGIYRS